MARTHWEVLDSPLINANIVFHHQKITVQFLIYSKPIQTLVQVGENTPTASTTKDIPRNSGLWKLFTSRLSEISTNPTTFANTESSTNPTTYINTESSTNPTTYIFIKISTYPSNSRTTEIPESVPTLSNSEASKHPSTFGHTGISTNSPTSTTSGLSTNLPTTNYTEMSMNPTTYDYLNTFTQPTSSGESRIQHFGYSKATTYQSSPSSSEISTDNLSSDNPEISTNDLSSSSNTKIGNMMPSWPTSGYTICTLDMFVFREKRQSMFFLQNWIELF